MTPQEAQTDGNPATTIGNSLLALRQLQFLPPFLAYPNAVEDGRVHDDQLSWSLRLAFAATPGLDAYAAWSTGFKASSINLSRDSRPSAADFVAGSPAQLPLPAASPIRDAGLALVNLTAGTRFAEPEKVRLLEVGLRYRSRQASASLTVFDQHIRDFQTTLFVGNGFVLGNAGRQSTRGVELEGSVAPAGWLRIDAAGAWLDARYDRYPNAQSIGGVAVDYSGRRVAGVSRFTGTLGATATWPLAAGTVLAHASYTYESPTMVRNDMPTIRREVNALRGSLTWRSGRGFDVVLWGQNLLDAQWLVQAFPGVLQPGTISAYPNEPRTYGMTLRFRS
jgi:outer membrane receptor protein involved in Fe transport